nr:hypothetical protein [Variovorax paradoxus]
MSAVLHMVNACVVLYNLFVLLPGVWRYGFDWKGLALVVVAVGAAVTSSVILVVTGSAA